MGKAVTSTPDADAAWKALLALSRDAVLIVRRADRQILEASPSAERIYLHGTADLREMRYEDLTTDPLAVGDIFENRREHIPLRFHRRADGSRFPVEIDVRWMGAAGAELGCFRVHDLSRLEREEQRIRTAEASYGAIFESAPYAALLLDRRGMVSDVNEAALGLYGHTRNTLIGAPMTELVASPRTVREYFRQTRWHATDETHRRSDGSTFIADVVVSQVKGATRFHAVVMVRDVTEERALTARLKASETRWRFALEGHGDVLWEWDIAGDRFMVSQAVTDELWPAAAPHEHDPVLWSERVHPADRVRLNRALVQHLKGETQLVDIEVRLQMNTRGERWVWMRGRVLERDAQGRALRLLGSVRDVHDQKMQAAELARWRDQVQHTERVTSMGELAATLAHELNQPLTAIRTGSAAALRHLDKNLGDEPSPMRDAIQMVSGEALRAGQIIQQMRAYLRKGPRRQESVAVPELLQGVQRLAELRAARMSATVELSVEDGLPLLRIDRTSIEQLLLNLINNGLDAMRETDGPRTIGVAARAVEDGQVELCVWDHGQGLPETDLETLCTPFYTTKADGLGMGLAICQTIVEAHQGRLWAEPHADGGAAFFARLPAESPNGP